MKHIGGFFEFDVGDRPSYHPDAIKLSTGRACIRLILQNLNVKKCYVPYYSCDALYEPFHEENIDIEYYEIDDQLDPVFNPELKPNEYYVYINYFGIKTKKAGQLRKKYNNKLILDNTHAFFEKSPVNCFSFTSARKYFGIPDGAYLFSPIQLDLEAEHFMNFSIKHNVLRSLGKQDESYIEFLKYEQSLNSDIKKMSLLSESLLSSINYKDVIKKRKDNFSYLYSQLQTYNKIGIVIEEEDVPFAFPYLMDKYIDKSEFHKHGFYIPSLWLDPVNRNDNRFKKSMALGKNLIPIPIDHRYSSTDLKPIVDFIKSRLDD